MLLRPASVPDERKLKSPFPTSISMGEGALLGFWTGLLCGLLDAASMHSPFLMTDRIQFTPIRIWFATPAMWILLLVFVGAIAGRIWSARWVIAAVLLAGPGLLVSVRLILLLRYFRPSIAIVLSASWCFLLLAVAWLLRSYLPGVIDSMKRGRLIPIGIASLVFGPLLIFAFHHTSPPAKAVASRGAPDVLLIFLDTARGDALGLFPGSESQAPNLGRWARGARVYQNAWAPYPWTLPSHLSVMTGFGPGVLEIDWDKQRYHGTRKTLAEIYRERGYATHAIFSNPFLNPGTGMERGFALLEFSTADLDLCRSTFGFFIKMIPNGRVPICRLTARDVTDRAMKVLRTPRPKPLFLSLNYFDAHLPYYIPPELRPHDYEPFRPLEEYPVIDRALRRNGTVPEETTRHLKRDYELAVLYLDRELGRLLEFLEKSGAARRTIIAIVSDHGEQFGEHGLAMHGNSVYRQVLHVPLLLRGPGISSGVVNHPVSVTDLYGTLARAAGGSVPRTLGSLPESDAVPRRPVLGLYSAPRGARGIPRRLATDAWSVVRDRYHLIRYGDGKEELFDLAVDPDEKNDLNGEAKTSAVQGELRTILTSLAKPDRADSEARRFFFSLGYMQ